MSLKYQCVDTGNGWFAPQAGIDLPTKFFFTQKLFDESEEGLYRQVQNASGYPGAREIVVTPDAHVGTGVPVGCVIATDGTLLMEPVGYDIGCGILCFRSDVDLSKGKDDKLRRKFSEMLMKRIGVGLGTDGGTVTKKQLGEIYRRGANALHYTSAHVERDRLEVDDDWTPPYKALLKGGEQLGSLGSGNHFAELQHDENGKLWGMIHTGSRGFGYHLAHQYQMLAREELKERGIRHQGLEGGYFLPDSPHWKGYKNAVAAGGNFAVANRLTIFQEMATAFRRVFGAEPELVYEISHNLAQEEITPSGERLWVHRKGATRAFPAGHPELVGTKWADTGHPILIPGSMGDTSYILFPEVGVSESLYSVNHGCGRKLSRSAARQKLSQSAVNKRMKQLNVLVNGGGSDVPIDESPDVYKPSKDVIEAVVNAKLARIAHTLTPLATIKGAE